MLQKEFLFNERITYLAQKMLQEVKQIESAKNLIFVGIHARRGDLIKNRRLVKGSLFGSYESKFFNFAMDIFRERYNNNEQKVVFLPTSDDFMWIKTHLISNNDIYYSRELVKESREALPNRDEVRRMAHHPKLAVKGIKQAIAKLGQSQPMQGYGLAQAGTILAPTLS